MNTHQMLYGSRYYTKYPYNKYKVYFDDEKGNEFYRISRAKDQCHAVANAMREDRLAGGGYNIVFKRVEYIQE